MRLLRINADARAPTGMLGADWFAKRLSPYATALSLAEFSEAVRPLLVGVDASVFADVFHSLGDGASRVAASQLQARLFGAAEPVYLDRGRSAHSPFAALYTERRGESLVHNLAATEAWRAGELREERTRATQLFTNLDQDAHNMHHALRALYGVPEPNVAPPRWRPRSAGGTQTPTCVELARSAGQAAALASNALSARAPAVSRRPDRGALTLETLVPTANFATAPKLRSLVRRPSAPAQPPALRVVSHRAKPTIANMAVCRPSQLEVAITAVAASKR
jgi:hypothetical protein